MIFVPQRGVAVVGTTRFMVPQLVQACGMLCYDYFSGLWLAVADVGAMSSEEEGGRIRRYDFRARMPTEWFWVEFSQRRRVTTPCQLLLLPLPALGRLCETLPGRTTRRWQVGLARP